jgi:hypothetical protein
MATAVKLRLHPIHRDETEKYLIVYGRGDLEVLDTTGTAATVNITAAAHAYLINGAPTADNLRMVSVADYTIIVNTNVDIQTAEQPATSFSITKRFDTWTKMTSRIGVPNAYYETEVDDGPSRPAGFYQYQIPNDANNGFATWRLTAFQAGTPWRRPNGYWPRSTYQPIQFRARFQRQALAATNLAYTHADHLLTLAGAFTSYTHKPGDEIHLNGTGSAPLPEGWYPIKRRVDANSIELTSHSTGVDYREGGTTHSSQPYDPIMTYEDSSGDKGGSNSDYISVSGTVERNFEASPAFDQDNIAETLQEDLRSNAGCEDACIYWEPNVGSMVVVSPFRGTGTTIIGLYVNRKTHAHSVTNQQAPFRFNSGTVTPGGGADNTLPEGDEVIEIEARWTQVASPGDEDFSIDANTMPVKMVRTTVSPLVFDVDVIDWKERLSGDRDSNPAPSLFVDLEGNVETTAIADVGFHRNRLVLAGDESLVFSRDGDFFNFFAEKADDIIDSDPIDRSLSSDQVTLVDFVVSSRKTIVIFTKAGRQFELNAPEAFTANTTAVTPTTSYTHTPGVRPKRLHDSLIFAADDGNRSALYDYHFSDELGESAAEDVSAHVQDLLPLGLKNLVVHPNNGAVFVLPTECNVILVYQTFFAGSQREQAAWGKWVFATNYQIDDIAVLDDELYLIYWDLDENDRRLEKIDISRDSINPDSRCFTDTDPTC